jgi:hypothetical protein
LALAANLVRANNRYLVPAFSVLIAEEGWFDANTAFNVKAESGAVRTTVPVLLAWTVGSGTSGNATCLGDSSNTAVCHSSYSTCIRSNPYPDTYFTISNGSSGYYTCKCWDGYQGNPYLAGGCQGKSVAEVCMFPLLPAAYTIDD